MVLTLCGVLKDILLVAASMLIWDTKVGPLQAFGYSISLGGIVYYKLGYNTVRNLVSDAGRQWNRSTLVRRIFFVAVVFAALFFMLGGFSTPASPLDQDLSMVNSNKRIMDGEGGEAGEAGM